MNLRFLSKLILLSTYSAINGGYELIHCNNPETNEPEMKFRISKQFYDMYFDQLILDVTEVSFQNTTSSVPKNSKLIFSLKKMAIILSRA